MLLEFGSWFKKNRFVAEIWGQLPVYMEGVTLPLAPMGIGEFGIAVRWLVRAKHAGCHVLLAAAVRAARLTVVFPLNINPASASRCPSPKNALSCHTISQYSKSIR